jgi:hypothetical protein
MATRFVNIDRDTPLLLPPDLRDWVPADHLAHFIVDTVEALDVRQVKVNTRGSGVGGQQPSSNHQNEKLNRRRMANPGKHQHQLIRPKRRRRFV